MNKLARNIFIFAILEILLILPCKAEIEMACVGDSYYDGDLSNGECIKTQRIVETISAHTILISGDGSKIDENTFELFSGKIIDIDRQNSLEIDSQMPHTIKITSGLGQKGKPFINISAENLISFIIYDYDINRGLIINYSVKKNKLQLTQANWTNSSQILRALVIESMPSCQQEIVIGNHLNLYLDESCRLNATIIRGKVLTGLIRFIFKNCTTQAEELYFKNNALSVKKGFTFCNRRAVAVVDRGTLSLPSMIDGDLMLIVKGDNITMRGNYKQKGIVAYSITSSRMKILDGSLEIDGVKINGKNLYVFHDFDELCNFEQGTSIINGQTIDLRKMDGIKNNAVFIGKKGLQLTIANSSSFDLIFDDVQIISIKNGEIKSISPSLASWKDCTISNVKGEPFAECYKGVCDFKKNENKLSISLAPYFKGKELEKIKGFYLTSLEHEIVPKLETKGLIRFLVKGENTLGKQMGRKLYIDNEELRTRESCVGIHEEAHAQWRELLSAEQKAAFSEDVINYLDKKEEFSSPSIEITRKAVKEDLEPYHIWIADRFEGLGFLIAEKGKAWWLLKLPKLKKRPFELVDTDEGWAYTAQKIWENCKGYANWHFPPEILKHYEGIINPECLEKAKG